MTEQTKGSAWHPSAANPGSIQPDDFRRVLGHFPTGVTVVTAIAEEGAPVGMTVGSFSSVSLDPPLVAFYPDRSSSTFPRIRSAASFCVNILAEDQEWVCRRMARKGAAKFESIAWTPAPSGAPVLTGCVGWIDCTFEEVRDAGDHLLVMGRVSDLEVSSEGMPLIFFQGGYGRFSTSSLAMPEHGAIGDQLRVVDLARPEMERLSSATGVGCLAVIEGGQRDLVVAASTRQSRRGVAPTQVGQHVPMSPPLGALFIAWAPSEVQQGWLAEATDHSQRDALALGLERIRSRGFSLRADGEHHAELDVALASIEDQPDLREVRQLLQRVSSDFEPESLDHVRGIRQLAAPVFAADGQVVMTLNVFGVRSPVDQDTLKSLCTDLLCATGRVSAAL